MGQAHGHSRNVVSDSALELKLIKFILFFLYSIFYKVQVQVGSVCIGVLVETSPKENCPEFFFLHTPFLQKISTNITYTHKPYLDLDLDLDFINRI